MVEYALEAYIVWSKSYESEHNSAWFVTQWGCQKSIHCIDGCICLQVKHSSQASRFRYPTANDFGSEIIPASTKECNIEYSIAGIHSRLESGVELKNTMMIGADYYETDAEIVALLAEGKVSIGIGKNTKIRNCIIDKNARIGKNVMISNTDNVQEADRPSQSLYICTGITVVLKKLNNP